MQPAPPPVTPSPSGEPDRPRLPPDPRRRRRLLLALATALALLLALLAGAATGAVPLAPLTRLGPTQAVILLQIRLPRVVLAALTGAALAVSGTVLQALFRNPLADPYVLGVSSGAALAATLVIAFLPALPGPAGWSLAWWALPAAAFAGAAATLGAVLALGRLLGRPGPATLLLAGVALSTLLSAGVSLVATLQPSRLGPITFWLLGGFSGADWRAVALAAPPVLLGLALVLSRHRELDALLLGEERAGYLGVEVPRELGWLLIATSLLTAGAVALAGMIGFVGLLVPHLLRLLSGSGHRWLLPLAAGGGAAVTVGADLLARTVVAPGELPVGVVTALAGAPFFLLILLRVEGRRERWPWSTGR
ncbi:MAG: iron ABC transporter permease [Bacillota bacterium]|nr:iron ABC transporter permease [Bacillota bacterium]